MSAAKTTTQRFPVHAGARSIIATEGVKHRVLNALSTGFILSNTTKQAVACSGSGELAGQPSRKFRKELIRTGNYVKPSAGLAFSVDRSALDHWVETFSTMRANGVDVTVPVGHTTDAEANRGYVRDLFRDGDSLVGIIELVGEDAIRLAGRSDVSIYSPPEYTDGKGNRYVRPITHVALVTNPVVPGLKGFEALAASFGDAGSQDPIVLVFQEDPTMPDQLTTTPPPAGANDGTLDPRAELKKAFRSKILKAIDDESLDMKATLKAVGDLLRTQEAILKKLEGMDAGTPEPTESVEATVVPVAASLGRDKLVIELAADNRRMKLDALVAKGKITPAVRDKLAAQFIGPNNEALALDLSSAGNTRFDGIVAALAENETIPLGEKTRAQLASGAIVLSNGLDKPGKNALLANAEQRAAAAAAANTH